MAAPKSPKINIYEELRAQRAEMPPATSAEQAGGDEDLLLDSVWLRASLASALLSVVLTAVEESDHGRLPWWATAAVAARDPVGFVSVMLLAVWTGLVAEAKGRSRLTYTLWALLTPGFISILVITTQAISPDGLAARPSLGAAGTGTLGSRHPGSTKRSAIHARHALR
jgi:hypothetical protein